MNAFDYLDSKILTRANNLVRGYNSVTGGTKVDLANLVTAGSSTLAVSAILSSNLDWTNPGHLFLATLGCLFFTYQPWKIVKKNIKQEELENDALRQNASSLEAYSMNKKRKSVVIPAIGAATIFYSSALNSNEPQTGILMGTALLGICANNYIMRADNLPPKKSFFETEKDKIKKYFADRKKSRTRVPVYVYQD